MRETTRSKPRIGLDLDGVTFNTFHHVLRTVNAANQTEVPYCNLKDYPLFPSLPGSTAKQISEAFDLFWEKRHTEIGLIHPEIPGILATLSRHYEIHVTTSAAKGSKVATPNIIATLDRHKITYDALHHVRSGEEKVEIGKKIGIDIHIEDDLKVAHFSDAHVILYPQPWVWGPIERNGGNHLNGKPLQIHPKPKELDGLNGNSHLNGSKGLIIIVHNWRHIRELLLKSAVLRS